MDKKEVEKEEKGLEVRTYFVRNRNVLLARADFSDLFVDYYLHLADHKLRYEPQHDQILKDAIAALTLHCASRPRNEMYAWTINFQKPLVNLFVTGDNAVGNVVGKVFTENVKKGKTNLFFSEMLKNHQPNRRSVIEFEGVDCFRTVEHYYHQSEQRPARYFKIGDEDFVMMTAQPDCDLSWLEVLTDEGVKDLDKTETLSLLEKRYYQWFCGCNQDKIMKVLEPTMKTNPESLFEGEESVTVHCPRCHAPYTVTRESLEAFLAQRNDSE